jgi:2-polyprenyl-3-methyl-5-hydroxy-6-metoxy-1,4-benzoquinol methylase
MITKEQIENYALKHLDQEDNIERIDALCASLDVKKVFPYIIGRTVLEMGAGSGYYTEECIRIFGHSYIVDASSLLLIEAKRKYGDSITCFESFFENFIPPASIKFDTILATHIFEHVENPVLVLKQIKKWLNPDGRIIITVPNAESIHRQIAVKTMYQKSIYDLSERDKEVGHFRVYDINLLRDHVIQAGDYQIIEESGMFLKTVHLGLMKSYSDDLLKALFDISDEIPAKLLANILMVIKIK